MITKIKRFIPTFLITVVFFNLGAVIGSYLVIRDFHCELIEKGFAEYNSKTGEWQYRAMESIFITESIPPKTK